MWLELQQTIENAPLPSPFKFPHPKTQVVSYAFSVFLFFTALHTGEAHTEYISYIYRN